MVFPRIILCSLLTAAILLIDLTRRDCGVIMSSCSGLCLHRVLYRFIAGTILHFMTMSKKEYSVQVE